MNLQEILNDLPVIDVTDGEHYAVAFAVAEVKQKLLYSGDTQAGYLFGKDKENTILYFSRYGIKDENGIRMTNPNDIFIGIEHVESITIYKKL